MEITLIKKIDKTKTEQTTIYAEPGSITQSEFAAAGQKDIKPARSFIVWAFEYEGQTEVIHNKTRYTVYRTYQEKESDRIELYCEERLGRR